MSMTVGPITDSSRANLFSHERLVELFSSDDANKRFNTVMDLADRNNPEDIEPLRKCLQHEDPLVVSCALSALGYRGDRNTGEGLFKYLYDEDEGVRIYAAWALQKIMGKESAQEIVEFLANEPNHEIFCQTAETLLENQSPELAEAIIKYICFNLGNGLALTRLTAMFDLIDNQIKQEGVQKALVDEETKNRFLALIQLGIVKNTQ